MKMHELATDQMGQIQQQYVLQQAATKVVRIQDTRIVTAHVWSMHVNAVR